MDEALAMRIAVARDLLSSGQASATSPLPADRMLSLLSVDQAVELLLRTVLPSIGQHPQRDWGLPALLQALCDAKPQLLEHRDALERLRRLRDRVMHDGIIPSVEDAQQFATGVGFAFQAILERTLGLGLEELTLAHRVRERKIRADLLEAEKALADSDPQAACTAAASAFQRSKDLVLAAVSGRGSPSAGWEISQQLLAQVAEAASHASTGHIGSGGNKELANFRENFVRNLRHPHLFHLQSPFDSLVWPLLLAQFGVALDALRRFEEIAPKVLFGIDGKRVQARFGSVPSLGDARFCVEFAARAALKVDVVVARASGSGVVQNDAGQE